MTREEKIELLQLLEEKHRREKKGIVFGIVSPTDGHVRSLMRDGQNWAETKLKPDMFIAEKLEKVLKSNKRFIVVIGGRGSGKSVQVIDIAAAGVMDYDDKVYCLREFQNSISESMYSTIKDEIERLNLQKFEMQSNEINYGKGGFRFKGLARNPSSIKSAQGFRRFIIEEAQFISEESLTALTPTARNKAKPGLPSKFLVDTEQEENKSIEELNAVQMFFIGNPASSADPFSQRFIVPFENELIKNGYYEDDLHLVVVMNYDDNPWYCDSGLETERLYDLEHKSRAMYDHIWLGHYNDSVPDSIIMPEWFDACVDAHKKLTIKPRGSRVFAFDPADTGPDAKGYAYRFGNIFYDVGEIDQPDINSSADDAAIFAKKYGSELFVWDCDGMGIGLKRQFTEWFGGSGVQLKQFRGSGGVDAPDEIYEQPHAMNDQIEYQGKQKTNRETFKNKRAQNYWALRDMCYKTYRAVVFGEMFDQDSLISFSSEIKHIEKLRSEICRIPQKKNPSGVIQIMSKQEMAKLKISSPNMADSVMMALDNPEIYDYSDDDYNDRDLGNVSSLGY